MSYLDDVCSEMGVDIASMSDENSIIIGLMTKKYMEKNNKEISRLKNKIKELEKKMDAGLVQTTTTSSGGAPSPAPAPTKSGSVMISEYKDAFLITGKTYNIKSILKGEFNAMWNPDCKGWKITKNTEDKDEKTDEIIVKIRQSIKDYIAKINYVNDNIGKKFSELY